MAAGDIKGPEAIVMELTAGAAVAVGQLVHLDGTDHKYDPAAADTAGSFAVAVTAAAADTDKFRAVVMGPVEILAGGAMYKGDLVEAGALAGEVRLAALTANGEVVGMAMEDIADEATGTIWVTITG